MRNDMHTLVQAAQLYYEQGLTQADIGRHLSISRSTVSRLLQDARDSGIVRIIISYPWKRDAELEAQLCAQFALREVRVLSAEEGPDGQAGGELGGETEGEAITYDGIGALAATYLDEFVRPAMTMGVSYGRSIASTIRHLNPIRSVDMTFVQILGALNSGNPLIEGPDLVRQIAAKYEAAYKYLYVPMIVENTRTRDLLLQELSVQSTLLSGRNADAVILGIGAHVADASGLIWTGYLNHKELSFLQARGAVGHMCAQHYDAQGNVLDVEFNQRVISIGIQALRNIDTVIAVAGTKEKAMAILGALRGQYLDVLITDAAAAQEVLRLNSKLALTH